MCPSCTTIHYFLRTALLARSINAPSYLLRKAGNVTYMGRANTVLFSSPYPLFSDLVRKALSYKFFAQFPQLLSLNGASSPGFDPFRVTCHDFALL
jgi:hypothetical protein